MVDAARGGDLNVFRRLQEVTPWVNAYRRAGLAIGFVPTLGALHAGHRSLMRAARRECDRVVLSVFVNPTQFGPDEDLDAYPRTPEDDLAACRDEGVDLVWFAERDEMYPPRFQTWVAVEDMTRALCGVSRPHHFRGVTTVVPQLLHVVRPHRAYFGQKDYQQSLVIRRLVDDLHIDTEVRVCPTQRDPDGLAVSSRNRYLSDAERQVALRLNRALGVGRDAILAGNTSRSRVTGEMMRVLQPGGELRLDYLEVRDAETLAELSGDRLEVETTPVVIVVAAFVGQARLIDNVVVQGRMAGCHEDRID